MRSPIPFIAAAFALSFLLGGCGASSAPNAVLRPTSMKASAPQVGGPTTYEAVGVPAPVKTAAPAKSTAGTAYTGTTGGTTTGGTGAVASASGQLEAEVIGEKNGSLLGMGTYKAQILVSNPTSARLTGQLTVTFLNGEKASKTAPIVRAVDVPANGEITVEVEDKRWTTDGAEAEVTTDAAPPGNLTASVVSTKNGSFLGMGKFVATVEVSNPTAAAKTATVVVTFTNKGEAVEGGTVRQEVELGAGETETLTFENKKWSTDGAEVEVE